MGTGKKYSQTSSDQKSANVPTMERLPPRPGDNVGNSANVPTMEQIPGGNKPTNDSPGSKTTDN